jgi:hypothetical protein
MPQYYPKSQITINLYTNGKEYFLINTQIPYTGYYYKLSTGKKYTGKTPDGGQGIELTPNTTISGEPPLPISEEPLNFITTSENKTDAPDNDDEPFYNYSNTLVFIYPKLSNFQPRALPTPYYSTPTGEDFEIGEYRRYFAKKTNEYIYIEISKETYTKFKSNDPAVASDLYNCLYLPWNIEGEEIVNRKIVAQIERNNKWYGFTSYFRGNFG